MAIVHVQNRKPVRIYWQRQAALGPAGPQGAGSLLSIPAPTVAHAPPWSRPQAADLPFPDYCRP